MVLKFSAELPETIQGLHYLAVKYKKNNPLKITNREELAKMNQTHQFVEEMEVREKLFICN